MVFSSDTQCWNCFQPRSGPVCEACGHDHDKPTPDARPPGPLADTVYITGAFLARGGQGIVYAGYDTQRERLLAIKEFFLPEVCEREADGSVAPKPEQDPHFRFWRDRFRQESTLLLNFRHYPHIVDGLDLVAADGTLFLIMERLNGVNLYCYLFGNGTEALRRLDVCQINVLLDQLLTALEALHNAPQPVVHRDLNPNNVFLVDGKLEQVKLLDFGLAREDALARPHTRIQAGTFGYAAPEQFAGGPILPVTDFYGLAATLYTAITGQRQIPQPQRLDAGSDTSPDLVTELVGLGVALPLAELIRDCLRPDPAARPGSVAAIRRRLTGEAPPPAAGDGAVTLTNAPDQVAPDLISRQPPSPETPSPGTVVTRPTVPAWVRPRVPLLITVVAAVLVASVAVGWWWWDRGPRTPVVDLPAKVPATQGPVAEIPPDEIPAVDAPDTDTGVPGVPFGETSDTTADGVSDTLSDVGTAAEPMSHRRPYDQAKEVDTPAAYQAYLEACEPDCGQRLDAWYQLGRLALARGDTAAALDWLERAAGAGYARAQHGLGVLHARDGHPAAAAQAYRQAAEQDYAPAQVNLGWMYHDGRGVAQSRDEAARWFRRAAEAGDAQGQASLAYLYETGRGVPRDRAQALDWYGRAAAQGHDQAARRLEQLR